MEWLKEQSWQARKVDTQNIHELASVVRKRLHLPCVIPEPKDSNPVWFQSATPHTAFTSVFLHSYIHMPILNGFHCYQK